MSTALQPPRLGARQPCRRLSYTADAAAAAPTPTGSCPAAAAAGAQALPSKPLLSDPDQLPTRDPLLAIAPETLPADQQGHRHRVW